MKSFIQWTHKACIVASFFLLIYHLQLLRVPDPTPTNYIIAAFAFCVLVVSSIFGFDNSIIQVKDSSNDGDGEQDLDTKYRVDFIQKQFPTILENVNETDRRFLLFIEGKNDFPSVYNQLEVVIDRGENEIIEKIDSDLSKNIDDVKNELNANIREIEQLKTENINMITQKWTARLMQETHKGISEKSLCGGIMELSRREIFINNIDSVSNHFDNRMNNRIANYERDSYSEQVKADFVMIVKDQNKEYYKLLSKTIKMRQEKIVNIILPKLKQYIKNPI